MGPLMGRPMGPLPPTGLRLHVESDKFMRLFFAEGCCPDDVLASFLDSRYGFSFCRVYDG